MEPIDRLRIKRMKYVLGSFRGGDLLRLELLIILDNILPSNIPRSHHV